MTDVTPSQMQTDNVEEVASDRSFIRIAVILGIITAIEVAWSYLPMWDGAEGTTMIIEIGGLIAMMILKFVIVAAWFMHLKFDRPVLGRIFYGAFMFAMFVFIAALAAFEVWTTKTPGYVP